MHTPHISPKQIQEMRRAAEMAMDNSYTVVYNFPVGASVLTDQNNVYGGCVVDGMVNGLGTCAERNAINTAVSQGEYGFKAVFVTAEKSDTISPCGACLQTIYEFSALAEIDTVILMDNKNQLDRQHISEMIENSIDPRKLGKNVEPYIR